LVPLAAVEEAAGGVLAGTLHQRFIAEHIGCPGPIPGAVQAHGRPDVAPPIVGRPRAPLLEEEGHPGLNTLVAQVAEPLRMRRPGAGPRFPTDDNPVQPRAGSYTAPLCGPCGAE